jgi:hypothetical protein
MIVDLCRRNEIDAGPRDGSLCAALLIVVLCVKRLVKLWISHISRSLSKVRAFRLASSTARIIWLRRCRRALAYKLMSVRPVENFKIITYTSIFHCSFQTHTLIAWLHTRNGNWQWLYVNYVGWTLPGISLKKKTERGHTTQLYGGMWS